MPPRHPVFHIAAPPDCAVAQRIELALSLRGVTLEMTTLRPHNGVAGQGRLTYRAPAQATGQAFAKGSLVLHDSVAMLELVEDLFPDHPLHPADPVLRAHHRDLIGRILVAHQSLAAVTSAQDPRDLDLAIYRLRDLLCPLDEALELPRQDRPQGPLSNLSIALAPLLWRLRVIDQHFQAKLGAGLPRLRAQAEVLLAHPAIAAVLDQAAAARLVARLTDSGPALAGQSLSDLWDRAFVSAGAENKLLSGGSRTKVPSIGRRDAFR